MAQLRLIEQAFRMGFRHRNSTWFLAAALLCAISWTGDASGKATYSSPYTLEQTFHATLRLLRVDRGYRITERDEEAAYILFEYASREGEEPNTHGSVQLVPQKRGVQVAVQLPKMPQYHEEVLKDALRKKLLDDFGTPPPKRKPKGSKDANKGKKKTEKTKKTKSPKKSKGSK